VALGEPAEARAVLAGLSPDVRDRTELRVAEAAIELADGRPAAAVEVLGPALDRSEEPIRLPWQQIQALIHDAAAREELGDACTAHVSFERALSLAAPERIVLPFTLPVARDLLKREAANRTAHPGFVATIRDVLAGCGSSAPDRAARPPEELSEAELRVLSYLPSRLTCGEIADELYISVNTVRTHVRHVYAKLGTHTRTQAVLRARELGLLVSR
jgi:LuxR family maltose regulon positive regulatory protein